VVKLCMNNIKLLLYNTTELHSLYHFHMKSNFQDSVLDLKMQNTKPQSTARKLDYTESQNYASQTVRNRLFGWEGQSSSWEICSGQSGKHANFSSVLRLPPPVSSHQHYKWCDRSGQLVITTPTLKLGL
jgi:hypothetical protein